MIHTKLVVEANKAKFLSLGFGDISRSEADVVCVSSFRESSFVPRSSIGAIAGKLRENGLDLLQLLNAQDELSGSFSPGACTLIDLPDRIVSFRKLLVVWMGGYGDFLKTGNAETAIRMGLQGALSQLRSLALPSSQIDVTALGSQYGGIH